MKQLRCLIIDDEPLAIELLQDYIRKTYFLEDGFSTTNPLEGLQKIQEECFDLVFLDIQMPELNGMELLKIINNKIPVILTTAYSDFALESYDFGVVDYLLKPISYDRFYKSVLRVKDRFAGVDHRLAQSDAIEKTFFFVKADGKQVKLFFDNILYIQGLRDYINIKTDNDEVIILESLKNIELQLPKNFMRIHKSFIVNLDKIQTFENNRVEIDKAWFAIGESYRPAFQNWIKSQ